jgi:hypothetical protein
VPYSFEGGVVLQLGKCLGMCCCVRLFPVPAVDLVSQQAAGQADAVAPDVAQAVYALAAASGSDEAYQTLVNMYEQVRKT